MVDIVVSVAAKVSEYLVDPFVRQLGYLFNYRTNIEDLSQQVEKLKGVRDRQQHSVDEAKRNGHEIFDDVPNWLTRADGFIQDASKFLEDEKAAPKSCFNGLCPYLLSRHRLSREATKKAGVAAQIHGDGLQIERVSYRPPLQEIRSAPSEVLPSRISTLNEVMEALREANINIIGIWGLGGVGKSTLVKQVAEQAAQGKLFDKVVTASVLQTPDLKRIQGELADKLDMKFEEESEEGRAARLHQRMKAEKTILVVLDDLWAEVDLEKIGVPSPAADHHKGCKLLLTSRNRDVLSNQMGTQKDFLVEHLKEDEAWILFENGAGDSIKNNPDLESIAMDIAKECEGLPLAIATLAKALKNKSESIWKDALQQLKRPTSTNIIGVGEKVFSSLKLSYDYLEGYEVKSFFLLCGLYPHNYISTWDLLKYGVGLRLFQGTNSLEEAKNRMDALVDNLKASNLLLETGHNSVLRMHDVVRNTARKIASNEYHHVLTFQKGVRLEEWPKRDEPQKFIMIKVDDCEIFELPKGLVYPKLEYFHCSLNPSLAVKIPNTFFEGMKQLKVLDLSGLQLKSLPSSFSCLTNLRTLCLDRCELGDIVIISELKQLEILSLIGSDIEELPREIAQLINLKLLDLKGSSKLKVIPSDVISSLSRLENLSMENSFTQWEVEGKDNASLAELKHLSNLTSLDIQIPEAKLLPEDIVFDKLVRFKIFVGDVWRWEKSYKTDKTLKLDKFDTSLLHVVDGISKLLKRSEDLHLRELYGGTDAVSKLDGEGFPKLKHLKVESSPEIEYIVKSIDLTPSRYAFPFMEALSLNQLNNLRELSHGQFPTGSFGCLRQVEVEACDGLTFLFSLSVGRSLSKLEEIRVSRCENVVEIVSPQGKYWKEVKEDAAVNVPLLFPELRHLILEDLPKLSDILCFFEDEKPPVLSNQLEEMRNNSQLQLSLGSNLRFLKLEKCMLLVKLFPPSLLQNLEELIVKNCDNLEQIFDIEGVNVDDGHVGLLPKLEYLNLNGLPKVRHICNWGSSTNDHFPSSTASAPTGNIIIIFPKLTHLSLYSLPVLTSFSPIYHSLQQRLQHADLDTPLPVLFAETVAFPHLEHLHIHGVDNVKKIWDNQLPQDSFSKLKVVGVESCGELLNIFPSCVLKRSQSLHTLIVKDCISLKEVFDMEGMDVNANEEGVTIVPLRALALDSLPKVEKIWNKDSHGILSFQYLKSIMIHKCESVKNLLPASLVRDLQQLEKLHVCCSGIEEIIAKDISGVLDTDTEPMFVFPKVTSLELYKLPELKSLYPGAHTSQWPLLEILNVYNCHKLTVFAFETPTFEQRHHEGNLHMPLFFIHHVAFPYLKELLLGHNNDTEIWQEQFSTNSFPRLTVLDVRRYGNISFVIPSFMLQGLHNVEEVHVGDCSSVKEIFQLEGLEEEHQAKPLRRLRVLQLRLLPGLMHLWKENKKPGLDLQSLESLRVLECDNLINLVPSSVESFQNLATLDVRSCGNLRSLISPSVAKTLVKLETLIARGSYKIEEIVANNGEEAANEITFHKLQHMELVDLPNLTSFSSGGGYIFSFPSLEHMEVKGCPKMKIFSHSLPTTPKLKSVEVEDNEWHWRDDLNTTIQSLFIKMHDNTEVKSAELGASSA